MGSKGMNRRRFLRLSAGVLAGGLLAGCAPSAAPTKAPAQATAAGKPAATAAPAKQAKLVVFWRTNPKEIDTMKQAFADFEAKNPGLTVDFITVAGGAEGDTKLQAQFAGGTPPEVFASVYSAGLVDYVYRDMVLNLTPYIERDKYDQSDFTEHAIKTFTFGGKQYGIPRGGIPCCFFINKDLFDKAGVPVPPSNWEDKDWTWDKMLDVARKLTKEKDGKIDEYGVIFGNINYNSFPMLWGADIFPPEAGQYGIMRKHNLATAEVVNSFQKAADLIHKEKVAPTSEISQALTSLGGNSAFLSGKVAMVAGLANYASANDAKFKWTVAVFPRGGPAIQQRSMTFTGPWLIGNGCANPDEAWKLIKYLSSPEGQKFVAKGAVVGTARKSMFEWWLGQFSAPLADLTAVQQGGYKHGSESPNVRTVAWGQIANTLNADFDPLWLGKATADACAKNVAPKLDKLLNELYEANKEKAKALFGSLPA